jgi:hypothetical protein
MEGDVLKCKAERARFVALPLTIVREGHTPAINVNCDTYNATLAPRRPKGLACAVVARETRLVVHGVEDAVILVDAVVRLWAPAPRMLIVTDTDALVAIASEEGVDPSYLRSMEIALLNEGYFIVPAAGGEADAFKDHRWNDVLPVGKHCAVAVQHYGVRALLALQCGKRRPRLKHRLLLAAHLCPRAYGEQRQGIIVLGAAAAAVKAHGPGGRENEGSLPKIDEHLRLAIDRHQRHEPTCRPNVGDNACDRAQLTACLVVFHGTHTELRERECAGLEVTFA